MYIKLCNQSQGKEKTPHSTQIFQNLGFFLSLLSSIWIKLCYTFATKQQNTQLTLNSMAKVLKQKKIDIFDIFI